MENDNEDTSNKLFTLMEKEGFFRGQFAKLPFSARWKIRSIVSLWSLFLQGSQLDTELLYKFCNLQEHGQLQFCINYAWFIHVTLK